MQTYQFSFKGASDTIEFVVSSDTTVEPFVAAFLSLFPEVLDFEKRTIKPLLQNTPEQKAKIISFIDTYKAQLPRLNAVAAFFNRLEDNEAFLFFPNMKLDQLNEMTTSNYLKALVEKKDFNVLQEQWMALFEETLKKYTMHAYGDTRKLVGEKDKSKRICRFCNNTRVPLTFEKEAHAISEALGNKTLILFEECDGCNEEFSKTIEPDMIEYVSLFRTVYGIKGKGGEKNYHGKNFDLTKAGGIKLEFYSDNDDKDSSLPLTIPLEGKKDFVAQNVYKCLCKFLLSVIDSKYLPSFVETINWINGKIEVDQLPKIAMLNTFRELIMQPKIVIYIRKSEDKSLPFAIGEFHFIFFRYVFIVPLSSNDNLKFIDQSEYDIFWGTFKHYNMLKEWQFNDFSDRKKRKFNINLKIEKNTPDESASNEQ